MSVHARRVVFKRFARTETVIDPRRPKRQLEEESDDEAGAKAQEWP